MAFHPGILIFDRSGQTVLGTVSVFTVVIPRAFRLNEIGDFTFSVPQLDPYGNVVLDEALAAILVEDNLIYLEDELYGLGGWGGPITDISDHGGVREVSCLSGISLAEGLETTTLTQSGGSSGTFAQALILAAAAKQAAHGDAVLAFQLDGSPDLFGSMTYEGDVFTGLQQVASMTFAEFWAEPILGPGGTSLSFLVHWNSKIEIDHTGVVITDGPNGQLASGTKVTSSAIGTVNRIRLRGAPTHLSDFLDYPCVKSIVTDVSPEVELILDGGTGRLREDLAVNVNFGLSDVSQKALAQALQNTYISYYKTFLYAYHNRQAKPYLPGFDWTGPDGANDKGLTSVYFKTYQKFGVLGAATVVTSETDGNLPDATIDSWSLDQQIDPLSGDAVVGIALSYIAISGHWIADGTTGEVYLLEDDLATLDDYGPGVGDGQTLLSIASDPGLPGAFWALVRDVDGNYFVRTCETIGNPSDGTTLISQVAIPSTGSPNDLAINYASGLMYIVGDTSGTVFVYDLASGTLLTPDTSFPSTLSAPTGLSISGGLAYVVDGGGHVKMLFLSDGTAAGGLDTGLAINGMYVDLSNRRIWMVTSDGKIAIYHAYVAVGTIPAPGASGGAPGFETLAGGQFVHVVMTGELNFTPAGGTSTSTSTATHVVVSGDTLWGLATHYYGNGAQWRTIYNANARVIGSDPSLIRPGEVLVIPGVGGKTTPPATYPRARYFIVYTPGKWFQYPNQGPIGQPDQLVREWQLDSGGQVYGGVWASHLDLVDPATVVRGEEGRVCDWNPTVDGYGEYKDAQEWRTSTGHVLNTGPGWYKRDWDISATVFQPTARPDWPEGASYAAQYLAMTNKKLTSQQFTITNSSGIWGAIELGGIYTLHVSEQGPRPSGIVMAVRAVAFSPSEVTGEMVLICEVWNG